ncbi:MAG: 2-oxoglutarate dehydrogenase complex dihydrolipoyllysine-residue succinyltransferase [Flavobacteriales bacterium]|nr:2-oxoglutarate dehydrogenase complex dihydrolipoyllysine-residue succinyltransferase [Flavobacteriales bacterium]
MPVVEITVPSPGESITEVEIATLLKQDGDYVFLDEEICEVDSDKATLAIPAEKAGIITWKVSEGEAVPVGGVIATIDTDGEAPAGGAAPKAEKAPEPAPVKQEAAPVAKEEKKAPVAAAKADSYASGTPSPAAKKLMSENGIGANQVKATGKDGRITKQDVLAAMSSGFALGDAGQSWAGGREQRREKMSMLRRKVAERLVSVKNETAMLTTFNEVNMKPIMDLRNKYKNQFADSHGVNLGFMSFFTKAVTEALYHFPAVNAMIDGQELVYHDYCDIGIAVSSPKGLMVPVVRNAEQMSLAEIEAEIKRLAIKARDGKISVEDMTGGTFTITNGGVFGSMMSTPIINPPQSAILGMHNIVERAVVEDGQIVARPMMYLALSYDHRIIDGKESVSFLVKVKNMLENPATMLFGGKTGEEVLLGL